MLVITPLPQNKGFFTPSLRSSVPVRPSVPHPVPALWPLPFWMDSFHVRHKWSLAWEGVSRAMTFELNLYLQGHSTMIRNKTAEIWHMLLCPLYGTYGSGWILSILVQISMRGCIAWNDPWPRPVFSRWFSCDVAYFMDHIHSWHKYNPWGDNVSCTIPRSIGQRSSSHRSFAFLQSGRGIS